MKTEEDFEKAMGRKPEFDDMIKINCPDHGQYGHYLCGWCDLCNRPRFACNCQEDTSTGE